MVWNGLACFRIELRKRGILPERGMGVPSLWRVSGVFWLGKYLSLRL